MPGSPTTPPTDTDLQGLQRRRKQVLALGVAFWVLLLLYTESWWSSTAPQLYTLIERIGLLLILVCILGRTWCTLYIGGHKKRALVTKGPYSVVRNPLYLFNSIGAAGIGAQGGSALLAVLLAAGSLAVFHVVSRREEAFLAAAFPEEFADYAARISRFWPRWSEWQDADELRVRPHLVRRTFLEACLLLAAVPVADLLGWLQQAGRFPVLLGLP